MVIFFQEKGEDLGAVFSETLWCVIPKAQEEEEVLMRVPALAISTFSLQNQ